MTHKILLILVASFFICGCDVQKRSHVISNQFNICTSASGFSYKLYHGIDAISGKIKNGKASFEIYIGSNPNINDVNFNAPKNLSSKISKIFSSYIKPTKENRVMYAYNSAPGSGDYYVYILLSSKGEFSIEAMNKFGNSLIKCK